MTWPPLPPLVLIALLLLLVLAWWLATTRVRRGNMRRGRIARRAETDAERLLCARGFAIEDRQVTARFDIDVDGALVEVSCRADLLVWRARRRYVAEVKTGGARDPTRPATRRQLLEYLLAFEADGVVLVDVARGTVVEVGFPMASSVHR